MRYVRITCFPVESAEHETIFVDAILDDVGNILGRHALFGLWGNPSRDQDNFSPFILRSDGMIIYDEYWRTENRYFRFNLRDGKVEKGRLLKYVAKLDPSDLADYRIAEISELPLTAA